MSRSFLSLVSERAVESVEKLSDTSEVSNTFGNLSPSGGSLAAMDAPWMPNRRWTAAAVGVTTLLLIWGTAFNGYRFGPVRTVLRALPYGDKVGHFGLYGMITLGLAMLVKTRAQAAGAGLAVLLLGVGDEFRQLLEPRRNFSITDVVANLGGVSLGLLAALLLSRVALDRAAKS